MRKAFYRELTRTSSDGTQKALMHAVICTFSLVREYVHVVEYFTQAEARDSALQ